MSCDDESHGEQIRGEQNVSGETETRHPHPHCLLCGDRNPWSLRLRFSADGDGEVSSSFRGRLALQGYDGVLHGGVIASLLDSAMTNCLFRKGIRAVTGELKIRYRHPVPCHAELELRARVVRDNDPLFLLESELLMAERIMAKASAKFMKQAKL